MTIELSEYVIDAIADAVVRKMGKPCDDAVDRAEAMTEIMMFAGNVKSDEEDIYIKVSDAVQLLRELQPVTTQPKMGHWIDEKDGYGTRCSKCGKWYSHRIITKQEVFYCSLCGAKMQEAEGN